MLDIVSLVDPQNNEVIEEFLILIVSTLRLKTFDKSKNLADVVGLILDSPQSLLHVFEHLIIGMVNDQDKAPLRLRYNLSYSDQSCLVWSGLHYKLILANLPCNRSSSLQRLHRL